MLSSGRVLLIHVGLDGYKDEYPRLWRENIMDEGSEVMKLLISSTW